MAVMQQYQPMLAVPKNCPITAWNAQKWSLVSVVVVCVARLHEWMQQELPQKQQRTTTNAQIQRTKQPIARDCLTDASSPRDLPRSLGQQIWR
jgi:hypothetical protein